MTQWLRRIALCFAAGAVGGLARGLLVSALTHYGATAAIGHHLAAALQPAGLYARIVWGGLYAFVFLLPVARNSWLMAGLLWGVVVTALQLVALPMLLHSVPHFALLPAVSALVLNVVWGLTTALVLKLID